MVVVVEVVAVVVVVVVVVGGAESTAVSSLHDAANRASGRRMRRTRLGMGGHARAWRAARRNGEPSPGPPDLFST